MIMLLNNVRSCSTFLYTKRFKKMYCCVQPKFQHKKMYTYYKKIRKRLDGLTYITPTFLHTEFWVIFVIDFCKKDKAHIFFVGGLMNLEIKQVRFRQNDQFLGFRKNWNGSIFSYFQKMIFFGEKNVNIVSPLIDHKFQIRNLFAAFSQRLLKTYLDQNSFRHSTFERKKMI